jgi:hypothetical protein
MSFSFHVESDFVWGSSWIGGDFLVAAGASVMATSFSELPAVLVQQETEGLMKFESASVKAWRFRYIR